MGGSAETYGNMARMGIRGREDLRGVGCSVWLTRCWIADFAVFDTNRGAPPGGGVRGHPNAWRNQRTWPSGRDLWTWQESKRDAWSYRTVGSLDATCMQYALLANRLDGISLLNCPV